MSASSKDRLGKGLDALLSIDQDFNVLNNEPVLTPDIQTDSGDKVALLDIESIQPNPEQPRTVFDEDSLRELAGSIKNQGIIQPVLVQEIGDGLFQIVAGERRYRAAGLAGLKKIPAIIKELSKEDVLEIALIENIQRENLTAIEEALAYQHLMENLKLTQSEVADRVGKNRTTVTNSLRLLKLPEEMQSAVSENTISAGHARAILMLVDRPSQDVLFTKIVNEGLSVREAEKIAQDINKPHKAAGKDHSAKEKSSHRDPDVAALEQQFLESLGTKVNIKGSLNAGRVEISYYSKEDLQQLYELLVENKK